MSDDSLEIDADSPSTGPKTRLLTLADLDGRTNAVKSARALIAALESDLGGAEHLTAGEHALAVRAAVSTAMVEHLESLWLTGRGLDVAEYCALVNVQRRLFTTIGLQRRSRDVTPDLETYRSARAEPTESPRPKPVPPSPEVRRAGLARRKAAAVQPLAMDAPLPLPPPPAPILEG
jgi:hypothetical protein